MAFCSDPAPPAEAVLIFLDAVEEPEAEKGEKEDVLEVDADSVPSLLVGTGVGPDPCEEVLDIFPVLLVEVEDTEGFKIEELVTITDEGVENVEAVEASDDVGLPELALDLELLLETVEPEDVDTARKGQDQGAVTALETFGTTVDDGKL
jgi:hypothetical protein